MLFCYINILALIDFIRIFPKFTEKYLGPNESIENIDIPSFGDYSTYSESKLDSNYSVISYWGSIDEFIKIPDLVYISLEEMHQ